MAKPKLACLGRESGDVSGNLICERRVRGITLVLKIFLKQKPDLSCCELRQLQRKKGSSFAYSSKCRGRTDASVGDESRSAEAAAAAPPRPHCRPPLGLRKQLQQEEGEEEENYQIATHSLRWSVRLSLTHYSACCLCLSDRSLFAVLGNKKGGEGGERPEREGVLPNRSGPHPTLTSARRAEQGGAASERDPKN